MSHLITWLSNALAWVVGWGEFALKWSWHEIVGACVAVLSAIPVPAFLSGAPGVIGNIPPGVAFFLQAFELPAGLVIIIAALAVRFVLRHLPFIGG